jgi:hypothetical protein
VLFVANPPRFNESSRCVVEQVTAEPKPGTPRVLVPLIGPSGLIHFGISSTVENPNSCNVSDPIIILFRNAGDTHAVTVVGLPAISTPNVITPEHGRSLPLESVRPTGPGGVRYH